MILALLLLLQDPVKDYRRATTAEERVAAVARIRETDTIVRIAGWDPDVTVRAAALDALAGRTADHDVQDLLLRIWFAPYETRGSPEAALREARRGAGDVPSMQARASRLLRAAPHDGTLHTLRDVLAGHTRVIAGFVRHREGGSLTLLRCAAAAVLGTIAGERDTAALIEALGDPDPRVRGACARALNDAKAVAALRSRATYDEPDADVRFEARRAIERIGGAPAPAADVEVAFVYDAGAGDGKVRALVAKKIRGIVASLESRDAALRVALVPVREGNDVFWQVPGFSTDGERTPDARAGVARTRPSTFDAAVAEAVVRLDWSPGSRKLLCVVLEQTPADALRTLARDFARADGGRMNVYLASDGAPYAGAGADLAREGGGVVESLSGGSWAFDTSVAQPVTLTVPDTAAAAAALREMAGVRDVIVAGEATIALNFRGQWSGLRSLESPAAGIRCTLANPLRYRLKFRGAPTKAQVELFEQESGIRKIVGAGGDEYDVFTDIAISAARVRDLAVRVGLPLDK